MAEREQALSSFAEWAHGWNGPHRESIKLLDSHGPTLVQCDIVAPSFPSPSLRTSVSLWPCSRFFWPSSSCVRGERGFWEDGDSLIEERGLTRVSGRRAPGLRPNVLLRDLDLAVPVARCGRRLEIIGDGLPLFGGVQLAVDATLVKPEHGWLFWLGRSAVGAPLRPPRSWDSLQKLKRDQSQVS